MDERLSVVIADDHRLFRQGLRALFAATSWVDVVGEASGGRDAVACCLDVQPDVLLLDLQMPDGSGIEAIRELTRRCPEVGILVLTMFDDDDSVFAAVRAGARGYVLKDAAERELLNAMSTVGWGGVVYSAAVARRIGDLLTSASGPLPATSAAPPFPTLTPSERRVLEQMARGLNNDAIAAVLGYSPKTIRNYVSIIFAKLHVSDRSQAIVAARESGLG